ncbi:MAG: endo-1,4-beta-xylanase [Lewinellaceae bacterium]|nr:endo-1,4-beta-xylanase [Lewinellaceae bacterium]
MKNNLLLLLLFTTHLSAQDAYHTALSTLLQTTFSLPAPVQWVLPNTETATLASSINYGGSTTNITVSGQPFSQARQRVVTLQANAWDAGHLYQNASAVSAGDKCLVIIWLRSPTANAKVNIFAENNVTYSKEVLSTVTVGSEWKMYAAPFQSQSAYAAGALNIGLHLAFGNQTIEIGGAACLNYKNTVFYTQLPVLLNNDTYPGQEPDAAWRADAATSIDQLRKANLTVQVSNTSGQPMSDAQVQVEMQQHAFKFGTAVISNKFNGGSAYDATYEGKLLDLDGNGHGFNELVFENDLKWPGWEQHWYSSQAEIASDVQWLHDRGISIRGHNLAWPGWAYSPNDINANATPAYIKSRIRAHLQAILSYPGVGTEMIDWDVLNEITTNNDYANRFAGTPGYTTGRELYAEIFKQADSLAPNSVLYLNDYVAIEQGDSPTNGIATWRSRIDELIAADAPLEGIGFQGHFSASPTGIPRIKEIYDEFWNAYGLEAKVTEYDIDKLVPAQTQADYMRDFLTVTFAHPSMKGFLMWGFWDGAHWTGNAPIFRQDWSLKPSGEAFIDQVFNQWWTNETLQTNLSGNASVRGFKGKYKVTVDCGDGLSQTRYIDLVSDTILNFNALCLVKTDETQQVLKFAATPTLVRDAVVLNWDNTGFSGPTTLRATDALGRLVAEQVLDHTASSHTFHTNSWPSGAYFFIY